MFQFACEVKSRMFLIFSLSVIKSSGKYLKYYIVKLHSEIIGLQKICENVINYRARLFYDSSWLIYQWQSYTK